MSRLKVCVVFGTRPEAIKMAPVVREIAARPERFESFVVATAQHREMLDQALRVFGVTPDVDLDIMRRGQSLDALTARTVEAVGAVLDDARPDVVLVQGDTTTTFASALAAYYRRIPVGHVEAGLRTGDKGKPFPEEINRSLTTRIADLHFAPTEAAKRNLLAEGVDPAFVWVTGNTVVDALLQVAGRPRECDSEAIPGACPDGRRMILATMHRRENWDGAIGEACAAIRGIVRAHVDVRVVIAAHRNPIVTAAIARELGGMERVDVIEPVDYVTFVRLMQAAYLIVTDSGGIQEEAPSLGRPVLVMRDVTERPEAVRAGTVRVVGTRREGIHRETERLLTDAAAYAAMATARNPYGDGQAAVRVCDALEATLCDARAASG